MLPGSEPNPAVLSTVHLTSEPSGVPARDEADTPLFNSPRLHHLTPEGSLLVCNRLTAKLSLLTASVSFHGKPTDSGLGHVTDFDPEDNDRLDVSKCLQEHAWSRLLEEET